MDQDEDRNTHGKRNRDAPATFFARGSGRAPDGIDSSSRPERAQENPMRFFERARATPRPSYLDKGMETGACRLQTHAGKGDRPCGELWRTEGRGVCRHGDPGTALSRRTQRRRARA